VKLTELARAILEVRCVVLRRIILISQPFDTVLQLSAIDTGFEDLLYLIFIVFVSSAATARAIGLRAWLLSLVAFKTAAAVTAFAATVAAVITIAYFGIGTTVLRVQYKPLARQRALPLARRWCSVIASVIVSAVIRSVAVATRASKVSKLALVE
jgi:hypothetical protein